ncbi:MAG: hypothetical protein IIA67_07440 [Planctomycetes bacterium]|nr:hypothetical protein [Planctomycetota bacterium]
MNVAQTKPRFRRHGHTLVELAAAGSLLAVALVPALAFLRDSFVRSRQLDTQNAMTSFCTSKLDEQLAQTSGSWATGSVSGDFSADGFAQLRFRVDRSDLSVDGGIVGRLMAVTATVWHDLDADTTLDADEPSVTFASKIAKLARYEDEATP